MGACSSSQRKEDSTVCFKAEEGSIPAPIKERALKEGKPVGVMSPEFGSKEETFFDSIVWLDTDCEDEFLSVNGDFTPSRCSTPSYESIKLMTPKKSMSSENFLSSKHKPSPTGRKTLAELLREASQGDEQQSDADSYQNSKFKLVKTGLEGDLYGPGDGSVAPCCLPSLLQTNGLSEKRRMNPLRCCAS